MSSRVRAEPDFGVLRLNPDGSVDNSFDADGRRIDNIGIGNAVGEGVIVQPDGKILAVASSSTKGLALARFNADGSLDSSFDADGKITHKLSAHQAAAHDVALQSDGKIVLAGDATLLSPIRGLAAYRALPPGWQPRHVIRWRWLLPASRRPFRCG